MKKAFVLSLMVAVLGSVFVSASQAADPNMPKFDPNAIMGRVLVVKDDGGTVTSIKVENRRRGSWNVVLDAKGLELAQIPNKMVKVEGTVATEGTEKWVTVESYTEMTRPQGKHDRGQRHPYDPNNPPPIDPNNPRPPFDPNGPPPCDPNNPPPGDPNGPPPGGPGGTPQEN